MEVSVVDKSKNELEIEVRGANETLLGPLMNHTLANPDVDYASYYMGHLVLDHPRFCARTKKGTRKKAIKMAVETIIADLYIIHISEPTKPLYISYAVFCLKKKKKAKNHTKT